MLAYNTVTDSGGPDALAELAVPGPYRAELYAVDADGLETVHEEDAIRVAPGAAATELADDQALADRTRSAAPDERLDGRDDDDAVAAFLNDDDRIEAIREQAQAEARDPRRGVGPRGRAGRRCGRRDRPLSGAVLIRSDLPSVSRSSNSSD